MCGINGVISKNGHLTVGDILLFRKLFVLTQERGTDSSGFAWDTEAVNGYPSCSYVREDVAAEYMNTIGADYFEAAVGKSRWMFGHSRASTQGSPTINFNNHPIASVNGEIVLVHNGHVYTQRVLGYPYKGQVDTEIIVSLIQTHGIEAGLQKVSGGAAVAFVNYGDEAEHDGLYLWRHSNPIYHAETKTAHYFASTPELLKKSLDKCMVAEPISLIEHSLYLLTAEGLQLKTSNLAPSYHNTYPYARKYDYGLGSGAGYSAWGIDDVGHSFGEEVETTRVEGPILDFHTYLRPFLQRRISTMKKLPSNDPSTPMALREFQDNIYDFDHEAVD